MRLMRGVMLFALLLALPPRASTADCCMPQTTGCCPVEGACPIWLQCTPDDAHAEQPFPVTVIVSTSSLATPVLPSAAFTGRDAASRPLFRSLPRYLLLRTLLI
jgi:hypothetical protein